MTQIIIYGQTPSQKNSKQIVPNKKTGGSFIVSNKRVTDWQKSALEQLDPLNIRIRPEGRLKIDYMFYVKDNLRRDIDNMITSVNDILQVACADYAPDKKGRMKPINGTGMITGDHWQVMCIGSADAVLDKENPRVEITITELPLQIKS